MRRSILKWGRLVCRLPGLMKQLPLQLHLLVFGADTYDLPQLLELALPLGRLVLRLFAGVFVAKQVNDRLRRLPNRRQMLAVRIERVFTDVVFYVITTLLPAILRRLHGKSG